MQRNDIGPWSLNFIQFLKIQYACTELLAWEKYLKVTPFIFLNFKYPLLTNFIFISFLCGQRHASQSPYVLNVLFLGPCFSFMLLSLLLF